MAGGVLSTGGEREQDWRPDESSETADELPSMVSRRLE
jgi:hypothetical protein